MSDLIIFEAGVRSPDGKYTKFMESPDRDSVEEYIEIMKDAISDKLEIVFQEKEYVLITTTPFTINTL